jgi:hypothetical protein
MDSWRSSDSALYLADLGAINADRESTKAFEKRGGQELNPIFGTSKPSGASVDTEMLGSAALVGGAAAALPHEWRSPFMAGVAGLELGLADQNKSVSKTSKKQSFSEAVTKPAELGAVFSGIAYALEQHLGGQVTVSPSKDGKAITLTFYKKF